MDMLSIKIAKLKYQMSSEFYNNDTTTNNNCTGILSSTLKPCLSYALFFGNMLLLHNRKAETK